MPLFSSYVQSDPNQDQKTVQPLVGHYTKAVKQNITLSGL